MGVSIALLHFFLVAAVICCLAGVSLLHTFTDHNDNPIMKEVSKGTLYDFESSAFSIDDHSFSPIFNSVKSIYQFGDSMSDTGNLIFQNPSNRCAKSPYGQTFFHKPTGRCSEGLLMIDYFAKHFNLPFLDPYLNKNGNFTHGVNFAVAGASALNASTLVMKGLKSYSTNSSLLVQLDWFKSHLHTICSSALVCQEKLAKSLIIMGDIGGNDYKWAFSHIRNSSEIYELVPEVVQIIKHAVKEVIDLGAIQVVVPGSFPLGCLPIILTMFKTDNSKMYDELQCLKRLNNFAKFHNEKVQQAIRELQKDYPHATIVYADYFSAMRDILQHATSLGFDKDATFKACCGIGNNEHNYDYHKLCSAEGTTVCQHPNRYVSWDGIHLTQHAYHYMANWLIYNSFHHI